jgi:PAS domain S-box-containing protein
VSPSPVSHPVSAGSPADTLKLVHELQVHQVELEMQNEELRRIQLELESSRARYFDLYDLAPVAYLTLSHQGLILEANLTLATLLGLARGGLTAKPFSRFIDPADQDKFYALCRQLLAPATTGPGESAGPADERPPCELRMVRGDGSSFHAHLVATPTPGDEGEIRLRAVLTDISARKAVETALADSENRYRRLFETAKDGILILNAESGLVDDVNPFLIELLGYSKESFLHKKIWELGFMKDIVANQDHFAELQQQEYIRYDDRPLRTVDGRKIDVEFVSNVYVAQGQRVIQCNIRDITQRKRAEDKVRTLSRLIEQAPLSVVITDLTGAIEYANPRFCLVTGYTLAEVIGQNPRVLKSGETPPAVYRDMWATLTRGEVWSGELLNRKKNGESYLENAVIAPVVDETGRTTQYVALKDDITAQKHHAVQATALLQQEHDISAMKTRLIGVISHDFRTPMTAVMASAEMLHHHLDELAPAKREELFERIQHSLQRLTVMLSDVLTLNNLDTEHPEVRIQSIDLLNFLRDTIEEIQLGDHSAHRFEMLAPAGLAAFVTDSKLLHHIISNLLSNAVRYSPPGTLITVSVQPDAGQVVISVEDQGIGIPEPDRERIFKLFERGSNVGTIKGTGLGLNIVERMTGLLGGTVTLASPATGGSCFTLTLPARKISPVTS